MLTAALLAAGAVPCMAADRGVHYAHGLLTVKMRGESLGAVLNEVQQRTGMVMKGAAGLTTTVNREVDQLPLVAALRVLLDGTNFLLVEGARASDTRVIVVGAGIHPMPAKATRVAAGSDSLLETALRNEDPAVRVDAVERVGERGDPRSLSLVSQLLGDPIDAVRAAAQQVINQARAASAAAGRSP